MKKFEHVHSKEKPQEIQIMASSVFIASDIVSDNKNVDGFFIEEYEYNLIQYDKDEYIQLMASKNKELEEQLLTTQEAICELYEILNEQGD